MNSLDRQANTAADPQNAGGRSKRILRKQDKLRFKSEFDQVRMEGAKQVGKYLLAVVAPAPDESVKCGVICGRKFNTLAVARNRARRLSWESFRLLKSNITPCRLVLIPRRKIAGSKRQEVTKELASALFRAGVLAKEFAECPPEC